MYWSIKTVWDAPGKAERGAPQPASGKFVLHRHRDADGPHLDLRLQQEGYLMGWRIAGTTLDGKPWATEKTPHPLHWLEQDGTAERVDEGSYAWLRREDGVRELELRGASGTQVLRVARVAGLPVEAVRDVAEALALEKAEPAQAGALIADGVLARRRAVERFCGLGRELDGEAFDAAAWRKTLAGMSLAEIQAHLRTLEVRFDRKYPPLPVSRPEGLETAEAATGKVLEILG